MGDGGRSCRDRALSGGDEIHSCDSAGNVNVIPVVSNLNFVESSPFRVRSRQHAEVQGGFHVVQVFPD